MFSELGNRSGDRLAVRPDRYNAGAVCLRFSLQVRGYYYPGFGRPVASIPALNDDLDVAEQVVESMDGGDY
jgi:hypothetical protein